MICLAHKIPDRSIRNLAENTQKFYLIQVSSFARPLSPLARTGPEEIRGWLVYLREERKLAPASLGATIGALRFLYRVTLKRDWSDDDFRLPRKPVRLPVILSLEEIITFFEAIASLKHRTILMTAYAAGLAGTGVRRIQLLTGHRALSTTARYLKVAPSTVCATPSPFDILPRPAHILPEPTPPTYF
ncbi:phage integrase N-terminal SAM-like domain-containing protein [Cupriavidus oxalaticus]|uniref:Core-binding (CB) domain-containing protein n=1 Tax=Cupriavidus oxalaticus TaxID=96344 RepID=A0A5P3VM76_9BURK|nr:phage integrase N-terminal SAM-like domain-containing protein [Cupriavidus oxalaticus]QEZ47534.1 hypothetical protein D2917_25805 [Cupriavidus oxalaticus]